jgi:hypothetical protein
MAAAAQNLSRIDSGNTAGEPRAPANVFETLWFAAPLKVCPPS